MSATPTPKVSNEVTHTSPPYTLRERFLLWLITWMGYLGVRLIGATMRFSVSIEEGGPAELHTHPLILCFWHRGIFTSTYLFRNQQMGVITSQSFDGEYISRIISKFNYIPVRGSSSRGGVRALLRSRRVLDQGHPLAITTDGPRGPAYAAKPGPVLLARQTGVPLVAFHIALEDPWIRPSWDRFMIPKPFSRALVCLSQQIVVPPGADNAQMERYHAELQAAQERVRDFAEANVKLVGSEKFPRCRI